MVLSTFSVSNTNQNDYKSQLGQKHQTKRTSHEFSKSILQQPQRQQRHYQLAGHKHDSYGKKLVRSRSILKIMQSSSIRSKSRVFSRSQSISFSETNSDPQVLQKTCNQNESIKRYSVESGTKYLDLHHLSSSRKHEASGVNRPRSASADDILLYRSVLPLWYTKGQYIESKSQVNIPSELKEVKHHRRKSRAMSMPDGSDSTSSSPKECSQMLEFLEEGIKKASLIERNGEISRSEEKNIKELLVKNCCLNDELGVCRVIQSLVSTDEEFFELDSDDTHSESSSDSSCSSPHHSTVSQVSHDFNQLEISSRSSYTSTSSRHRRSIESMDTMSDTLLPHEEEHDVTAFDFLNKINQLEAEFRSHRQHEESNALSWSVQHAARQGVIPPVLLQSLLGLIQSGSWEEARDVLYHKCHLVPAVGSVIENPTAAVPGSNAEFLKFVDSVSPTESTEARHQKLLVLKTLSDLVIRWVKMVGRERGLTEEHIALTSGALFLAGSYRLGLNDPLSDIDAVCVVPWHVTREDFFDSFCKMLKRMNGVCQLTPVPNAVVPLISLAFHGVSIDLLFARLPTLSVESHQEIDSDHMLIGVDAASMKSLNAPRVSSLILCLIPKRRVFRIVLRAVRAWARRRGIYGSKLGYLGGISWAILVAFVCQLYPDAEPVKVFVRFFQVLSEWQWPQPIVLNVIYDAGLGFEMWNPRHNIYDRAHIMPIITPAYPHMNSSVQVSQSTFSVIYEELWRARYLVEVITASGSNPFVAVVSGSGSRGNNSSPKIDSNQWNSLFLPSNFFVRYDYYLAVNFTAESVANMHTWAKFVQSRLRKLVESLQHVIPVSKVHAHPCYFPYTKEGVSPGSCMFIGLEFHAHHRIDLNNEIRNNIDRTTRFFIATDLQAGVQIKGTRAEANLIYWEQLPEFVFNEGRDKAKVERIQFKQELEKAAALTGPFQMNHNDMYMGSSQRYRGK